MQEGEKEEEEEQQHHHHHQQQQQHTHARARARAHTHTHTHKPCDVNGEMQVSAEKERKKLLFLTSVEKEVGNEGFCQNVLNCLKILQSSDPGS